MYVFVRAQENKRYNCTCVEEVRVGSMVGEASDKASGFIDLIFA